MTPMKINRRTDTYKPPPDWDVTRFGECDPLEVRVVDGMYQSLWFPTVEEMKRLTDGAGVLVTVVGGQPAIGVGVEEYHHEEE